MDGIEFFRIYGPTFVNWVTCDIEYPPHDARAYWHRNRPTRICHLEAALQAFRPSHGNGADHFIAKVLLDFESHPGGLVLNLVFDNQGVIDRGQ